MPLRNDLLNPISPDRPSGENLRYSPIYDKIKEARREDDDAPQGDWKWTRKLADWPLTIKLIGETLAAKTKDLQLTAWLAEAMLRREGVQGLREVLDVTSAYLETFWDTLYPEIEDGDAEFRAAPLVWMAERLELPIKQSPITKGRLSWLQYNEARQVGSEASAAEGGYEKQEARQQAIAEGKIPLEDWEKDFDSTPKQFYKDLEALYDATLESVERLSRICDEKFGDVSPSFRPMKTVLEEVRQTVHILLVQKLEKEPDEPAPGAEPVEEPAPEPEYTPVVTATSGAAAAAAPAKAPPAALTAEPQSWEDAVARVAAAAKYMRAQDASNPAPYLMLRGLRWGEVRASGSYIDQTKLAAPPSELRQALKKAALEGNWAEVLETAETAMAMECGRGWLDLQRYVGRACESLGYDAIRTGVIAELKALLADYPQLPEYTMMDDTATANAETLAWIQEVIPPPPPVEAVPPPAEPELESVYRYMEPEPPAESAAGEPPPPDAFELALQAARSGRTEEAIELLMREMTQEPSGRGRFNRKVQVAQLCLSTGNDAVALPILQEAAAEIERRKLEEWESREMVTQPLAMLYRCLAKSGGADEVRQKLYAAICRLDPLAAINISR